MHECVGGCVGGYFLMCWWIFDARRMCWWMGLNINLKGYEKILFLLVIIF